MGANGSRELWQEALGLLILRLGLAWFLFVWAVNKILAPAQYVKIWGYFHGIEIGAMKITPDFYVLLDAS